MEKYGYIRVSSVDQCEDRQTLSMGELGVADTHIFIDKQSGKDFNRPEYKALMERLEVGDLIYLYSLDRLGRSYDEIQNQWRFLTKECGVDIVVLDMPILDTRARHKGDLMGKVIADVVLQLLSFVAESEHQNIRKRQAEGVAAARARGVRFGRPVIKPPENFASLVKLWECGELPITDLLAKTELKSARLTQQTDSMGKQIVTTYDNFDRILSQSEKKSAGTQSITLYWCYNVAGNVYSTTDRKGNVTSFTYDAAGRMLTKKLSSKTDTYTYDKNGNRLTETDWRSNKTSFAYDPLDRVISITDPYGTVAENLEYNLCGSQISSTDALGHVIRFAYDRNGRQISKTDAAGNTEKISYDNRGNISVTTDANNNSNSRYYHYDRERIREQYQHFLRAYPALRPCRRNKRERRQHLYLPTTRTATWRRLTTRWQRRCFGWETEYIDFWECLLNSHFTICMTFCVEHGG